MVETYVCFLKIIHIFFFKKLNILTRSNVNRELVPLFHCRDCKSPSSLSFTRVFRASQGYASMPRLSRRNITNPPTFNTGNTAAPEKLQSAAPPGEDSISN